MVTEPPFEKNRVGVGLGSNRLCSVSDQLMSSQLSSLCPDRVSLCCRAQGAGALSGFLYSATDSEVMVPVCDQPIGDFP